MKKQIITPLLLGLALLARADVPGIITYQGRVTSNGTNFTGAGQFKFSLLSGDAGGTGQSLWSNDGSSVGGSEPTVHVGIPVTNGLFTVALGDTSLTGMLNAIPASAFDNTNVRLRIWFSAGEPAYTRLTPDQRITSGGYALRAANVLNGAITGAQIANAAVSDTALRDGAVTEPKLANGAVTTIKLADGSVTSEKIPNGSISGQKVAQNSLTSDDIADTLRLRDLQIESAGGLERVRLTEASDSGVLHLTHDTIGRFLEATGNTAGGFLRLYDAFGGMGLAQTTVELGSSSVGGFARVLQDNASTGVQINGQNGATPGGTILMYREAGLGVTLQASTSAGQGSLLTMYNGLGDATVSVDGDDSGRGSTLSLFSGGGERSLFLDGDSTGSGLLEVSDAEGTATIKLIGSQPNTGGGRIEMTQGNGSLSVILDGEVGTGGGGYLQLRNGAGTGTITLDSDFSGEGRITTQVLEITGGADLSESFDIHSPNAKPGMIVSIDPARPGELKVSAHAYDRTVAGVVSGAGGVKPGMLMGQKNSKADGKHPVALTGRVYGLVDAGAGAIAPGDLITTSDTPGHGMKVTDHARAQGAIIGKAMTPLAAGRGLVLLLVSLQ